jgi:hypothetical protein
VHARRLLVLLIREHVRGSNADSLSYRVLPPGGRHHPTNRSDVDGKTKDHDDIMRRHCSLATRKVERVRLWTPPVHKCCQRGGVHQRQAACGDEPKKRQEPRTTYERLIPLIPRQGALRVDPKMLQTLWNKIIVKKILVPCATT